MQIIKVSVQNDYLSSMSKARPLVALTEIIWNGFDADAHKVQVYLDYNKMNGLEQIRVIDDGHGITYEDALAAFSQLGGSWKVKSTKSKGEGRKLHGQAGKGRFRAFSLGSKVAWITRYKDQDGKIYEYTINGSSTDLGTFAVDDKKFSSLNSTGTEVTITGIEKNFRSLNRDQCLDEITQTFAIYMHQYPSIALVYDGYQINPTDAQKSYQEYKLDSLALEEGKTISSALTIIEWKHFVDRAVFLCDGAGFAIHKVNAGIQAPGMNFTAYVKSDYLKELGETTLMLEEMHPEVKLILDHAKITLKDYLRKRAAEQAINKVEEWKKEKIYPYQNEPQNVLEEAERNVFDVCALNLSEYLPDFEASNKKNKKMTLYFLKQAIESSPEAVQKILQDVLELPADKQQELFDLLKKTSLSAIINASKIVADRLDFIKGLEILVFNPDIKKVLLERSQLHRILAEQTWIFGEEYNLSNDDESLTQVLSKHLKTLRGEDQEIKEEVLREDGSRGIVDLMLSRTIPQTRADEHEHLIVELKRPSVKIDQTIASQLKSYAFAVAADERFKDTKTKWSFWAISNDITDEVRREAKQRNRPIGIIYEDTEQNITVWVKTWAQIIDGCKARLKFYEDKLKYCADHDSAIAYLKATHEKYLPTAAIEAAEVLKV